MWLRQHHRRMWRHAGARRGLGLRGVGNTAAYLFLPQPLRIRDIMLTLERATRAFMGTVLSAPSLNSIGEACPSPGARKLSVFGSFTKTGQRHLPKAGSIELSVLGDVPKVMCVDYPAYEVAIILPQVRMNFCLGRKETRFAHDRIDLKEGDGTAPWSRR